VEVNNKIIFLVGPPRSLSTAFLRMMGARNDVHIINEPALPVFNKIHYPYAQSVYSEQALASYSEVKNKIESMAKHGHVFVKEMSFSFSALIQAYPDLIKNPNAYFIFLLRDPHHCLISFYKKMTPETMNYLLPSLERLTGFNALHEAFACIKEHGIRKPHVVHAEQLYNDTANTVRGFCNYVGLPYRDEFLTWNNLGEQFTGVEEWQENKKTDYMYHWHKEAIVSQKFHQPTSYENDGSSLPTFSEIENEVHRNKCFEVYKVNKALYEEIRK
jgi:hypothetical protein